MNKKLLFKGNVFLILFLLVIQYLLGMLTNLFVQFPQNQNAGQLWEFAWKQISLASHIVVGISLLVVAVVLVIRAIVKKNKNWIIASTIGLVSIFVAGYAGASFVTNQSAVYSFAMSFGFIAALLSYISGAYFSG
jgi:hypothetical protein